MMFARRREELVNYYYALLTQYRDATDDEVKKLVRDMISYSYACRPAFNKILVSKEAAKIAKSCCGITDLSEYNDVRNFANDLNKLIIYEHTFTRRMFTEAMVDLAKNQFSREDVAKIVRRQQTAWISRTENKRLNDLHFVSKRPDNPLKAYEQARIEVK